MSTNTIKIQTLDSTEKKFSFIELFKFQFSRVATFSSFFFACIIVVCSFSLPTNISHAGYWTSSKNMSYVGIIASILLFLQIIVLFLYLLVAWSNIKKLAPIHNNMKKKCLHTIIIIFTFFLSTSMYIISILAFEDITGSDYLFRFVNGEDETILGYRYTQLGGIMTIVFSVTCGTLVIFGTFLLSKFFNIELKKKQKPTSNEEFDQLKSENLEEDIAEGDEFPNE